jgi:hypothetical protein
MPAWRWSNKIETSCHNKVLIFIHCCCVLTVTLKHFVLLSNSTWPHHKFVQGSALDTWRGWVNSFTPLPLYLLGNSPRYPLNKIGGPHSRSEGSEENIKVSPLSKIKPGFLKQPHSRWWIWLPLPQAQLRNYSKLSHNAMKVRKPDSIRIFPLRFDLWILRLVEKSVILSY